MKVVAQATCSFAGTLLDRQLLTFDSHTSTAAVVNTVETFYDSKFSLKRNLLSVSIWDTANECAVPIDSATTLPCLQCEINVKYVEPIGKLCLRLTTLHAAEVKGLKSNLWIAAKQYLYNLSQEYRNFVKKGGSFSLQSAAPWDPKADAQQLADLANALQKEQVFVNLLEFCNRSNAVQPLRNEYQHAKNRQQLAFMCRRAVQLYKPFHKKGTQDAVLFDVLEKGEAVAKRMQWPLV